MSTISKRQNEDIHIQQLQAQRRLYDEVRKIRWIRIIGLVMLNAIWIVIATLKWQSELIIVGGSSLFIVIELLLNEFWQDPIHKKAAFVQELFDCGVLDLKWKENLYGDPPPANEVARWADRYDEKKYQKSPLSNWYSQKVDTIPLVYGRLCCIYSNIDWDVSLRMMYLKHFWIAIFIFIIFIGVLIFFWGLSEVNKYSIIFAGVLPLFRTAWVETVGNFKSIQNLKSIRTMMNRKWNEVKNGKLNESELEQAARDWQNEILHHRQLSPVLPSKYYLKTRPKQEDDMNLSSGALAVEISNAQKARK